MKNQFKTTNTPDPVDSQDVVLKSHVNDMASTPNITRNTEHVDYKDKELVNVRFVNVNSLPAVKGKDMTSFNFFLINISHRILTFEPTKDDRVRTNTLVDASSENERKGSYLSSVMNDQDNGFNDNKLTNISTITMNKKHR